MYLGETRDDRLYVREAKRISITCSYSAGDVDEPGTEDKPRASVDSNKSDDGLMLYNNASKHKAKKASALPWATAMQSCRCQ